MVLPLLRMLAWICCLSIVMPCVLVSAQEAPAKTPTIEFPERIPTEEDYWRGWVDFHVENLTENYLKYSEGSAEAKKSAPACFRAVVEMMAIFRRDMTLSNDEWTKLLEQVDQQAKLHESDPLLQFCQGVTLFHAKKINAARLKMNSALTNIESSKYPRWLILPVAYERHRMLIQNGILEVITPSQAKLVEHAPQWLARAAEVPKSRRYWWEVYENAFDFFEYGADGKKQGLIAAFAQLQVKDPWMWEMAQGIGNIEEGWRFRGRGFANTVTPEGWQKLGEHMKLADEHLREAYEIAPEYPEAATHLITVSMAGFDEESCGEWFQRAIAAQCDFKPAYDAYTYSMLPRWGGSHAMMMEFAEQCARSKRFETGIPYFYYVTLNKVREDLELPWREQIADSKIYKKVAYVLKHMANDKSRKQAGGKLSTHQAFYLNQQLVLALHANQNEDAVELVERLGNQIQPQIFDRMESNYPFAVGRMYANRQFGEELDKLRAIVKPPTRDPEKAQLMLTGLQKLGKQNKEPGASSYFDQLIRRTQKEVDFHSGKWVELTFDPELNDWEMTPGQWTYESEHSVIATSIDIDDGFRCFHECQFPGPREVMCNIDVIESKTPYLFVGLYHGNFKDLGAMFWIEQSRKQLGAAKWSAQQLPYINIDTPKLDHLHIRIWGKDHVELYGSGGWQSFINKGEEYTNDPEQFALNRIGFGAMWCRPSASTVRFSNIRVRKLGDPPPEWDTDSSDETYAKIIAYYDRELESNPNFGFGYLNRALAKGNLKQYEAAVVDYERGLTLVPGALAHRGLMGSALCQLGKYREGLEHLERALAEGAPKAAPITNSFMAYIAYFLAVSPDDKVRNVDRSLELATKSCDATMRQKFYPLLALAVAQAEKGQFDVAIATIDEADKLTKGDKPKAALARCRQAFTDKKPWRFDAEKADEDIYWIGNE